MSHILNTSSGCDPYQSSGIDLPERMWVNAGEGGGGGGQWSAQVAAADKDSLANGGETLTGAEMNLRHHIFFLRL